MHDAYETYHASGVGPGMQKFLATAGLGSGSEHAEPGPQGKPSPEMLEAMAQMLRNLEFFLGHYLLATAVYEPDISALKIGSIRLVAAVGEASQGQLAHESGVELAKRLGTDAVMFPGDHGGFKSHPVEFAARLHTALGGG